MDSHIILDNLIDVEIQNQIEDSMFDCFWEFKMDNTKEIFNNLRKDKYRKFLNPFTDNISPSIITNILKNKKSFNLIASITNQACNHIGFKVEQIHRCIGGIQGVQIIRKGSKISDIHVNQKFPHLVLLYYVNDSDGDTIFFDKSIDDVEINDILMDNPETKYNFDIIDKVSPKKGRILFFDGKRYHASSSPTKGIRCIITLDLIGKFEEEVYNNLLPNNELKKNINNIVY